ncbi:small secreted protein [Mycobacterium kansasii]|uniref:Uncharacterized protein n=1 Tax=Mycobacterium innocens TaxID=2341083 RepID=A0A498PLM5_9MYCO|nr:DUF2613 family protein [Mycobacterium innocens]KZS68950.1 small secreted protein [Mycobacterium kansasii]VBA33311.1 hypothetical protein LAUMK13_00252 [Mycobacterium innocens]
MPGFMLAAAASIAAGLSMGAAATVGVTLLVQGSSVAPGQGVPAPAVSSVVQYGDRCSGDYCPPPCGETSPCLNVAPRPDDRSRQP